jgi:RHS repeat-associated protein
MMLDLNNLPGEPEQLERNDNRKFTAREDDGTGLYYYRARYYHPSLGRFAREDPVEFSGGEMDVYVYCSNDPVNSRDSLGLKNTWSHRGRCCNESGKMEWALLSTGEGAGTSTYWQQIAPGECVGGWTSSIDCEGMTCGGGFYKVSGAFGAPGLSATCKTPGCDHWPFTHLRWTPNPADGDPGATSPSRIGGPGVNNTPQGYQYGPRNCCR